MLAFVGVVVLVAVMGNIDVFNMPGISAIGISANETGEIMFALLLLIPAFIGDRRAARRRRR